MFNMHFPYISIQNCRRVISILSQNYFKSKERQKGKRMEGLKEPINFSQLNLEWLHFMRLLKLMEDKSQGEALGGIFSSFPQNPVPSCCGLSRTLEADLHGSHPQLPLLLGFLWFGMDTSRRPEGRMQVGVSCHAALTIIRSCFFPSDSLPFLL